MTVKQRIKSILSASHKARNSDFELWVIYCQKSGVNLSETQIEALRKMPSFETLRRTRQMIQNTEGSLRPDQAITDARFRKYKEMRQSTPYGDDPEKVLEQQGYKILEYGK